MREKGDPPFTKLLDLDLTGAGESDQCGWMRDRSPGESGGSAYGPDNREQVAICRFGPARASDRTALGARAQAPNHRLGRTQALHALPSPLPTVSPAPAPTICTSYRVGCRLRVRLHGTDAPRPAVHADALRAVLRRRRSAGLPGWCLLPSRVQSPPMPCYANTFLTVLVPTGEKSIIYVRALYARVCVSYINIEEEGMRPYGTNGLLAANSPICLNK